jgi:hypothetical protein
VCNSREPAREHVARHFTEELMEVTIVVNSDAFK